MSDTKRTVMYEAPGVARVVQVEWVDARLEDASFMVVEERACDAMGDEYWQEVMSSWDFYDKGLDDKPDVSPTNGEISWLFCVIAEMDSTIKNLEKRLTIDS